MPQLQINSPDGRSETRKLSRRNPIVIGRNPISDVHIDDESVAAIHCRVIWNGKAFEVAAVANNGIDVNGVLVRRKELTEGDVLRVGNVDLVVLNGSSESAKAASAEQDAKTGKAASTLQPAGPKIFGEIPAQRGEEGWSAPPGDDVEFDVVPQADVAPTEPRPQPKPDVAKAPSPVAPDDEPVLLDEPSPVKSASQKPIEQRPGSQTARPWSRLGSAKRPGEQDILTSPLVLGFGGLALVLLLAAGAIWLLMGREAADRLYAAANADREGGRFTQAIRGYEQFLLDYPTDDRALNARFALGLTRIERYAIGATPDYDRAIQEIDEFIRANRDAPGFEKQRDSLRNLARRIASGASAAAIRTGDRKYLASATEARTLFDRYSSAERSNNDGRKRLSDEFAKAEAAVRKNEYTAAAAESIAAAIAENDFASAFKTRRDLLTRYPDLRDDRRVHSLLEKTLAAEKQLVRNASDVSEQFPQAVSSSDTVDDDSVMLVGQTQARTGEVSDGRVVFAVARDALVGLEAVTGQPRWRTTIGLDPPFIPVEVDASEPSLLAFDTNQNAVLLLKRETGEVLWRTVIGANAVGPPLVVQGQIDLVTSDSRLVRLDLESGRLIDAVSFPQPLVGPPVMTHEKESLVVFGEQATAYTLDRRTLAVKNVSFIGHAAGSLKSPPQALGRLIVICENDRLDAATVRALTCDATSGSLRPAGAKAVAGQIQQRPIPRGNLLFVPSTPETITAFSVSDDAGQPALTQLAAIQIPNPKDVPTFLVPGPDGLLWAAGSALRKLRLAADGLSLLPEELAPGRHTQPPQESGESLFVARSLPSAAAVYVSQADRGAMTGSWRTILGASVVATSSGSDATTIVTEAGQFALLSARDLEAERFVKTDVLPGWDETAPEPLYASTLDGDDAVLWRGGESPLLWTVAAGNRPGSPQRLPAIPECPPIALDEGLVLPLPGRLDWLPGLGGANAEAFLLPVQAEESSRPKWRSLAAIDGDQFVALDDKNTLRVVRLRTEAVRHLDEVATAVLPSSPTQPLAVAAGRIVVVMDDRVQLLDPAGLRPVAEAVLQRPAEAGPWGAAETILLQTNDDELTALDSQELAERWSVQLDAPVAGRPLRRDSEWVAASQAGTVVWNDDNGAEIGRHALRIPTTGLCEIGGRLVALALNGSLHPVPSPSSKGGEKTPDSAGASEEAAP